MVALGLQRLVLRSAATPLRRVWPPLYRAVTRVGAAVLARGAPGAAVYLRAGAAGGELLPGMSDVDLALVAPQGAERARSRWDALRSRIPGLDRVIDWPFVFAERDLPDLVGACSLTYGLDGAGERAAYFGERPTVDWIRVLERPQPRSLTADWRLLRGPELRPREPPRDAHAERLAAWLEVLYWWRWAALFCDRPQEPRSADLCVKLVAEPARAWLWLVHGEEAQGRADALRRILRRLPEEEAAVRSALDLQRRLPASPSAPFGDALAALVRFTQRIAAHIASELSGAGATEVRLAGAEPATALPLVDWPALVAPARFGESFSVLSGDPGDPVALGAAVRAHRPGEWRALRTDGLLVLGAAPLPRTRMRAVKSALSDPVSFALVDGRATASFPDVGGWSAGDVARRAVAEHRAWLRTGRMPPVPWSPPPPPSHGLGMLLSAARAALFSESLHEHAPELALGPAAIADRLGPVAAEAGAAHAASLESGAAPPSAIVRDFGAIVRRLRAYA
jgi:hypothetical protein